MQATLNIHTQDLAATKVNTAVNTIHSEVITKISLFAGILTCLVLAINF